MAFPIHVLRSVVPSLGLILLLSGCGTAVNWEYPRAASTAYAQPETTTVGALFQKPADQHPGESGFSLVSDGSRAFMGRVAMADMAEKTLDAQYYIWDADTTGRILADHLIRAADRGVRVRILIDDHYQTEKSDLSIAVLDAHPNIEVRFFNPLANRRWRTLSFVADFGRVNHRMHNKLFIADNAVGVVGGRNIADTYFGVRPDSNFRDLDMAIAGPIVKELSASFDLFWNSEWAIPVGAVVDKNVTEQEFKLRREQLTETISATGYPYPINEHLTELSGRLLQIRDEFTWAPGRVLVEHPSRVNNDDGSKVIAEALLQRLAQTKRELLIESPYIILRDRGLEEVRQLTARGVKVRILTNSAATNDVMAAHAGYANTRKDLVRAGADLYELRPDSNMKRKWSVLAGRSRAALHDKAIVFDRQSVFIGSFNLDPRSTAINTEIGVLIDSPTIASEVEEFMDEGVSPGSAYHVRLAATGDLVWSSETNGAKAESDVDPGTSVWQRFIIDMTGLMPIDEQL
jgi:cardiolipin synthase C